MPIAFECSAALVHRQYFPLPRGAHKLKTYRRVEITSFSRRVTIVSGEWPRDSFEAQLATTDDEVSLSDTDSCEPIELDSPEGHMILVEAVRSLEQRLSPEARAALDAGQRTSVLGGSSGFYDKLRSFYQGICPKGLCSSRRKS